MKTKLMMLILLIFTNFTFADEQSVVYPFLPSAREVKNVILCIGDGMGIGQIVATRVRIYGAFGRLNFEKMPVTGFPNTCSSDNLITDSGAAGTALATGYKTNNNMIGVGPDGKIRKTILEACKEIGMATGLIATSAINHATPASFAAHVLHLKDDAISAEHS